VSVWPSGAESTIASPGAVTTAALVRFTLPVVLVITTLPTPTVPAARLLDTVTVSLAISVMSPAVVLIGRDTLSVPASRLSEALES
jgi:hypothetical protein